MMGPNILLGRWVSSMMVFGHGTMDWMEVDAFYAYQN